MSPASLLPHAGAMCLLDEIVSWDKASILCAARSHLHPGNPLRRAGRLGIVCGAEYAMQAAAAHGALLNGGKRPAPGLAAALRGLRFNTDRLDNPGHGTLSVSATLLGASSAGSFYALLVRAGHGATLLEARATIATSRPGVS